MRLVLLLVLAAWSLGSARAQQRYVIPLAEDTLLFVENQGATRILAELNGVPFKLATDPAEVARSVNAFWIPREGGLTLDIAAYMRPGYDANEIAFTPQGPAASGFRFVLAPVFVEGQTEPTYTLRDLTSLPEAFALAAFPSPTRGPLTVTYDVPSQRITGVPIRITLADALGRTVAVLVDDVRFPGSFRLPDALPDGLAAGLYVVHLRTDTATDRVAITVLR